MLSYRKSHLNAAARERENRRGPAGGIAGKLGSEELACFETIGK
jgi:hypothetical protein